MMPSHSHAADYSTALLRTQYVKSAANKPKTCIHRTTTHPTIGLGCTIFYPACSWSGKIHNMSCSKRAKISLRPNNNPKNIWEAGEIHSGTNNKTLCPAPHVNKQQGRPSALGSRSSNNSNKSIRVRLWRTEFMCFWIIVIYNMRWQPQWDKLQSSLIISREGGNDGSHYVQKLNKVF